MKRLISISKKLNFRPFYIINLLRIFLETLMKREDLILQYICSHSEEEPQLLQQLNRETHVKTINPRMLSGHLQGRILKLLAQMIGAKRIIELGTFTGYSALCFAEAIPDDGVVITIDHDDELGEIASRYFSLSPYKKKIVQLTGDALDVLERIKQQPLFDLAFIDADKRQYSDYFDALYPMIRKGGYLFADNTLWDGHVVENGGGKIDNQTLSLLGFNRKIHQDKRLESVILPLRDGLTIIRKL